MDKLNPRVGVSDENVKGDRIEHARMGFMEFAARHEQLVRDKNAIIEVLELERRNAWSQFVEENLDAIKRVHRIEMEEAFILGARTAKLIWLILGTVVGVCMEWGVKYYVR